MRFTTKIRIGKGYVHYADTNFYKKWKEDTPEQGCPLCNIEFEIGDPIFMVITTNSFPNTLIHKACVDHDLILTTHALLKLYEQHEQYIKTHKGWQYK